MAHLEYSHLPLHKNHRRLNLALRLQEAASSGEPLDEDSHSSWCMLNEAFSGECDMIADPREVDAALATAVSNLLNEKVLTRSSRNHHLEMVVKRQISGLLLGLEDFAPHRDDYPNMQQPARGHKHHPLLTFLSFSKTC